MTLAGRSEDIERMTPVVWLMLATGYSVFCMSGLILRPTYAGSISIPRGVGIGMAVLMVMGPRFWPSILVWATGAGVLLDVVASGAPTGMALTRDILIALMQTAEAAAGAAILRRSFGFPLQVTGARKLLLVLTLIGPLLCGLAAAIGLKAESAFGFLPQSNVAANWAIWTAGDIVGLLLALPLALFWPRRGRPWIFWKSYPLPRFTPTSAALVICLASATLGGWKLLDRLMVSLGQRDFDTLVQENNLALSRRLDALQLTLNAVRALSTDAADLRNGQWEEVVRSLGLPGKAPGVKAIGFVEDVPRDGLDAFVAARRAAGFPGLAVAPMADGDRALVVTHYVPLEQQGAGLSDWAGAFDARDFARSQQRGQTILSGPHDLPGASAGNARLLLVSPVSTPATDQSAAVQGWIVMPLGASGLFAGQRRGPEALLHTTAVTTATDGSRARVFDDSAEAGQPAPSLFSASGNREIFGRTWTVRWQSTPRFEAELNRTANGVVLLCGMAFVYLAGFYLLTLAGREQAINAIVARRTHELAEQIEENRSIIQTPSANIVTLDHRGTILFCNDSAARLFGSHTGDILGRPLCAILGQETAQLVADLSARQGQVLLQREVQMRNFAGADLVLDVQISSWQTPSGDRRYTVLLTDISEQRRAEGALRAAQHRLDVALSGAKIGVFEIDLLTGRSSVSETWKALMEINADAASEPGFDAQAEWRARVHPDDLDRVMAADRDCIEGRASRSMSEYRIRMPDGRWNWMHADTVASQRDETGRATHLIGAQTDITELVESKEALRASEEQFRSAIRAAPVAMAIVDRAGQFLQLNASLVALSGRSEEDLLGTNFRRILTPPDRDRVVDLIAPLESGLRDSFEVTARCLKADGSEIWCRMATAAIRDSAGHVRSYVVQILDIDAQMMLDRTKSEFISTVSHELRTPLTSINGSLTLLLHGLSGEIPPKARNMLEIAHKNAGRLIRLVNDILDLDKLAAERMRFEVAAVAPGALVRQSVDEIMPFAEAAGVSVKVERIADGAAALLDPNRFLQVMANLLSNAIKFSPTGGIVTVSAEAEDGRLTVSVTDHGPGVPVSFRRKIFSAFSQADASSTRSQQGSGLGLHISRQLVERMNGRIGFTSEPDKATTFWVSFPIFVAGDPAPQRQTAAR